MTLTVTHLIRKEECVVDCNVTGRARPHDPFKRDTVCCDLTQTDLTSDPLVALVTGQAPLERFDAASDVLGVQVEITYIFGTKKWGELLKNP